jgi:hypothetical protein
MFKPFLVSFEFHTPEQAQMYVIAQSSEQAAEGALETLPPEYLNVRVISAKEFQRPEAPTIN